MYFLNNYYLNFSFLFAFYVCHRSLICRYSLMFFFIIDRYVVDQFLLVNANVKHFFYHLSTFIFVFLLLLLLLLLLFFLTFIITNRYFFIFTRTEPISHFFNRSFYVRIYKIITKFCYFISKLVFLKCEKQALDDKTSN